MSERSSESPTHPDAPRARRRALKVWPQYFDALERGEKSFEFRRDDREPPYAVGDTLILREWRPDPAGECTKWIDEPGWYTGRECVRRVAYVARGGVIPEGYCVMSIVPLSLDAPRAGGETPAIDPKRIAADAVHRLADSEPDEDAIAAMDHLAGTPQESMFCVSAPVLERMIETTIADALFDASWPSLLERHRDGERETVCGMRFVVDRTIPPGEIHMRQDGRVVARLINVTDGEVAVGSAPPSPERAPHD